MAIRSSVSWERDLYEVLKAEAKKQGEKTSVSQLVNEVLNMVYAEKVAQYRKQKLEKVVG